MPGLRELQRSVRESLVAGTGAAALLVRADGLAPERRLQVYRNNHFASLSAALAAVYPVVVRLVGEEFFAQAATRYIREHPSRSGNVHDFGRVFSQFLAGAPGAAELVWLPDVARLEWAWHESFHSAGHGPLDAARLAAVAPQDQPALRFRLHPAARLVASPWPVMRIWAVNQDGHQGDPAVDLAEGPCQVLVMRPGLEVELRALRPGEFRLLEAFAAGLPLAEAAPAALAEEPDMDLGTVLVRHVTLGTLADIGSPA